MDLAIACGSIFLGFSTLVGGMLWTLQHKKTLASAAPMPGAFPVLKSKRRIKSRLGKRLLRAGRRGGGWVAAVMGFKVTSFILAVVTACVGFSHGQSMAVLSTSAIGVGLVGWILPEWWLSSQITARRRDINHYLIDMLDLLVICLEAGLSFNASLIRVVNELQWSSRTLSEELQYTNHEIQMGRTRAEALRNLGDRCGNDDFSALIAVLIQAERFGMSMAKTLRIQVESMRQKRRQKIQQVIQTIPVKMLFPMIVCIFPQLLMIILGPACINIWIHLIKHQ